MSFDYQEPIRCARCNHFVHEHLWTINAIKRCQKKKCMCLKYVQPTTEDPIENKHRQIKGYRELSQDEIDLMNEVKQKGVELGELVEKLRNNRPGITLDQRWVSIGATDLQTGLMALTRAIAQPTFF